MAISRLMGTPTNKSRTSFSPLQTGRETVLTAVSTSKWVLKGSTSGTSTRIGINSSIFSLNSKIAQYQLHSQKPVQILNQHPKKEKKPSKQVHEPTGLCEKAQNRKFNPINVYVRVQKIVLNPTKKTLRVLYEERNKTQKPVYHEIWLQEKGSCLILFCFCIDLYLYVWMDEFYQINKCFELRSLRIQISSVLLSFIYELFIN